MPLMVTSKDDERPTLNNKMNRMKTTTTKEAKKGDKEKKEEQQEETRKATRRRRERKNICHLMVAVTPSISCSISKSSSALGWYPQAPLQTTNKQYISAHRQRKHTTAIPVFNVDFDSHCQVSCQDAKKKCDRNLPCGNDTAKFMPSSPQTFFSTYYNKMDPSQMMNNPELMGKIQGLMADPEIMALFQKPGVMQKMQGLMSNPSAIMEYANDPDMMKVVFMLIHYGMLNTTLIMSLATFLDYFKAPGTSIL